MDAQGSAAATDSQRFDVRALRCENQLYHATGGVSAGNAELGFLPAFRDSRTGRCYLSRFADGQLAPVHVLDGLPDSVVLERDAAGQVVAAIATLTSGFSLGGRFFTREEAAQAVAERRGRSGLAAP